MICPRESRSRLRHGRRILTILLLGTATLISSGGLGRTSGQVTGAADHKLVLGFMNSLFAEVRAADAMAAMKVWATEIKRQEGFEGSAETKLFHDLDSVVSSLQAGEIDLVIVLSQDYVQIAPRANIEPHYVVHRGGTHTEQSVLLVHRESGIKDLDALQKEELIVLNDARSNMGRLWLETLLFDKGFLNLEGYFGKIRTTERCSKAVLPVFFRQAPACLVHRSGFELMTELNPQLLRELTVVGTSPEVLPSITCIRPDYDPVLKKALIESLGRLHEEPRGRQILMLFKVDRLVPFKESYLEGTQNLLNRHDTLKKKLIKELSQQQKTDPKTER